MKNDILRQLALNTNLIPDEIRAAIKNEDEPPTTAVIMSLLIHSLDCWAFTEGDSKASMAEKRLARQALVNTFLLALDWE
jgi:hypothetical protein